MSWKVKNSCILILRGKMSAESVTVSWDVPSVFFVLLFFLPQEAEEHTLL